MNIYHVFSCFHVEGVALQILCRGSGLGTRLHSTLDKIHGHLGTKHLPMQQVIVNVALFSLMFYFCQLNWNLMRTNLMLHEELYINCFVITAQTAEVWQFRCNVHLCSTYVCIANWLCNKSFVTLWNGTSELANQRSLWTRSRVYNKRNCWIPWD